MSFHKRLQANDFVVLAEMHTPKGVDISGFVNNTKRIKGRVDAVVVPDMDNGIMKMSALAGGSLVRQQGMEPIISMYCRDRNRLALQGDALAAYVMGIQNILVTHCEDISQGDHSEGAAVKDITEVELLNAIKALNGGKDMAGFELEGLPNLVAGCTIAPYADASALDAELKAAAKKVEAGAAFIITPPVFDTAKLQELAEKTKDLAVPIIPTVFLIKSLAIAQYIANSEPTSGISDQLISRIRKSSDRELEGVKIAGETVAAVKDLAQGVMLQTIGWEHKIPEILDNAGI